MSENTKTGITQYRTWEKTTNFRIHRLVTSYTWSCKWDPVYTETFQQEHRCMETGERKWEPIEIVTEEVPNCPMFG